MHTFFKNHIVTFLLIIVFSNKLMAFECLEKSPNLLNLKDDYYNLENGSALTNNEIDKLNGIYEDIDGRWEGEVNISECSGPDNAPVVNTQSFSLTADITANSSGRLFVAAEIYNKRDNISGGKNLDLLNSSNIMELKFFNKDHFSYSEKHRLSNANRSSRLVEHMFDVKRNGDSLAIELSVFVNGVFVTNEAWLLTKK